MKRGNYLGPAGENATKAELLRRGYNVGKLELDEGIDLVIYDTSRQLFMSAQVKSSKPEPARDGGVFGQYQLSHKQLRRVQRFEFFYVFALERTEGFEFVVVPRKELLRIRVEFEKTHPKEPKSDDLNLRLFYGTNVEISCWGQSFAPYLGWDSFFPQRAYLAK